MKSCTKFLINHHQKNKTKQKQTFWIISKCNCRSVWKCTCSLPFLGTRLKWIAQMLGWLGLQATGWALTSEKWYSHQLFYISFPLLVSSQLAFNVVAARVNVGRRVNRTYFCNSLHWGCGPWQLHKNKGWKVWIYTPAIWALLPRPFLRCLSTSMPKCYDCFSLSNVKAAFGLMQAVTASSSAVFCW